MNNNNKRPAVERNLERIDAACGLQTFLEKLFKELLTGATLNVIRKKLPYELSENKLRALIEVTYPELAALLDLPVAERRAKIQTHIVKLMGHHAIAKTERDLIASWHDPEHWLFKYFTEHWFDIFKGQAYRATTVRGIEWKFTFMEWIKWWVSSGRFGERGRHDGYVMCRKCDEGPYAPENCYVATGHENFGDGRVFAAQRAKGLAPSMPPGRFFPWTGVTS